MESYNSAPKVAVSAWRAVVIDAVEIHVPAIASEEPPGKPQNM